MTTTVDTDKLCGMSRTATHQLLDQALGRPLVTYLGELRAGGLSWRETARTVKHLTGIDVSSESLRRWYEDAMVSAASSAPSR